MTTRQASCACLWRKRKPGWRGTVSEVIQVTTPSNVKWTKQKIFFFFYLWYFCHFWYLCPFLLFWLTSSLPLLFRSMIADRLALIIDLALAKPTNIRLPFITFLCRSLFFPRSHFFLPSFCNEVNYDGRGWWREWCYEWDFLRLWYSSTQKWSDLMEKEKNYSLKYTLHHFDTPILCQLVKNSCETCKEFLWNFWRCKIVRA